MAVRRLMLFATLVVCLALAGSAWAGTLTFNGFMPNGQGQLDFTPGLGNSLTIGAGNGGNGALVSDFINTGIGPPICGGDCTIVGGYLTLTTGPETSGFSGGGIFSYSFGAGGVVKITGEIPMLGINSPTVLFMASTLPGTTFSGAGSVGSFLGQLNLASIVLAPQLGTYHFTGGSNDDLSFGISPSCSTGGVCKGSLVQSTTALQTIPEPATLSVLGVGLFTFGAGLRRRMGRAKPAATA
jgi:PEP-CTERM motif